MMKRYCSFCEKWGHTLSACPARDDNSLFDELEEFAADFGGVEDGFGNILSDADPGL
jgi:hypothetical protein